MQYLRSVALALLAVLPLALAQASASSSSATAAALAELPPCAVTCLLTGISHSTCAVGNTTCACENAPLLSEVALCVAKNCTVKEGLVTKNVTNTLCDVPVRDEGHKYYVITIVFAVIAAFTVLVRLGFKRFLTEVQLTSDDWFIFATIIAGVPSAVITVHGTLANGLGKDIWTVPVADIYNFLRFFYAMALLYFLQVTLLKMSLLFFYLRIFPSHGVRRLLWATVYFNAVYGAVFVLLSIFQCRPISYFWDNWDGEHQGTCLDINNIAWSNAAISIALDIWMLAIPLAQLRTLNLHWKKKIGVGLMFGVGTFVTVVSILRLQSLVSFANTTNPTWDELDVSIWSTVEITVGIICACMPTLRLLLVRLFPSLGWSGRGTGYSYSGSGANGGSSLKPGSKSRSRVIGAERIPGEMPPGAIELKHEYSVRYGDHDEASLVQTRPLEFRDGKSQSNLSEVSS